MTPSNNALDEHAVNHDDLARLHDMERRVDQGAGLKPGEARRLMLIVSAQAHMLKAVREERDAARAEVAEDQGVIAVWRRRTQRAEGERDAEKRRADVLALRLEVSEAVREAHDLYRKAMTHDPNSPERIRLVDEYEAASRRLRRAESALAGAGEKP